MPLERGLCFMDSENFNINAETSRVSLLKSKAFRESSEYFRQLQTQPKFQVPISPEVSELRKHQVFVAFFARLSLSDKNRGKLINAGLNDEIIDLLPIRECPALIPNLEICKKIVDDFGAIDDVPGFMLTEFSNYKFEVFDSQAATGLLCPQHDLNAQIVAIRLFRYTDDKNNFVVKSRRT